MHSFGPLQERNFRHLWLGRTASTVGDSLSFIALAFAVLGFGGSGTDLGLVIAAYSLPVVVFLLIGGVWADRLPRRAVMIATDLVRAAAQLALAVGVLTGNASVPLFVLAAFITGTAQSFFQPAAIGIVPQAVSEGRLQQANALLNLSASTTMLFGPVVSGLLVVAIGPGWVFAIDGVTFLISAVALASLRLELPKPAAHGSFLADMATGWREVRARRWLPPSLAAWAFVNLSFAGYLVIGPMVMASDYRGAPDWGLVVAAFGLGGLLGGATALRWRPARPLIVVFLLMAINVIRLGGVATTPPLEIVLLAVLIASLATALGDTIWHTTVQSHVPSEHLSRVSSYDWMVSLLFFPLGAAIAGPLADTVGASTALWIFAGMSTIPALLVLALPAIRNVRRIDQPVDVASGPASRTAPESSSIELEPKAA